jgi:hypothetical protein
MHNFNVDPLQPYDGPDFEEFCIAEGKYLSARRDRSPCIRCTLSSLCQAGFEEQVRRVSNGHDPSLTKDCTLSADDLTPERLFDGLSPKQIDFVRQHIPGLTKEDAHGE